MSKREDVITNLRIIRTWAKVDGESGRGIDPGCCADIVAWTDEALTLIDNKPRVMKADELRKTFYLEYYLPDSEDGSIPGGFFLEKCSDYWEEHKVINIGRRKQTITYCIFKIDNDDPEDEMYFLKSEENKRWRCWTFKPTEEEREETAWNN